MACATSAKGIFRRFAATTLAALSALVTPSADPLVYSSETDAWYEFVSGSTATVDGYTALTAPGGRYLIRSSRVSLAPDPAGGDDSARVAAVVSACARKATVVLRAGTWHWNTAQQLPNAGGVHIEMEPGVSIVGALTPQGTGTPTRCIFYWTPPAATATTTLSADVTAGSRTITVTSAPVGWTDGTEIALVLDGLYRCRRIATNGISGTTITLEDAIWEAFPAASTVVRDLVPLKDVVINGNGAAVSGTFDALLAISAGARIVVRDLHGVATASSSGDVGYILDKGTRAARIVGCTFDGADVFTYGLRVESCEDTEARNVRVKRCLTAGVVVTTGKGVLLTSVHALTMRAASGNRIGFVIDAAATTSLFGPDSITLVGCTAFDAAGKGFDVRSSGRRIRFQACEARHAGAAGFVVNQAAGGGNPSNDCHFSDCVADYCQNGFYVIAGSVGVTFSGCQGHNCTQYGIGVEGTADITGFNSRECTLGGIYALSAAKVSVRGFDLSKTFNGGWNGFRMESTASVNADDGRIAISGSGTGIHFSDVSGGTLRISRLSTTGGSFGVVATAGPVWRGTFVDMSGPSSVLGTQYSISGSAQKNFGTVSLNGTSPQTLAFTAIKAQDRIAVRRTVNAGTPGHYTATASAGVGVVVASQASDTSTLQIEIG